MMCSLLCEREPDVHLLVTGATGFVGRALLESIKGRHGFSVRGVVRCLVEDSPVGVESVQVSDLSPEADWNAALSGIDVVIHTAARVHVMSETVANPLVAFRRVNVDGTLNLARQAAAAGVRRFVFVSSIKVNGEYTDLGRAFAADDVPDPQDSYGISKYEAELGLRELAAETQMNVVIIRPPLIYGPGVKANFQRMMQWLRRGVPLPLGAIHNKRSLIALDNLVDLIVTCLNHPAAANQTFLAADGEDLSTTELLHRMGLALGRSAWLIPVPISLLETGATLLGMSDMAQRLCGSLQVDISKTRTLLGWNPPISVDEGLCRAAQGFLHATTL